MRTIFLSLDFEEIYHLPYLKKYNINYVNNGDQYCNHLNTFFDFLKSKNIKITVFVVAELVQKNLQLLKRIVEDGHEIACHSMWHKSIKEMSNDEFVHDLFEAKKMIEQQLSIKIYGFRAPSFSMDLEKIPLLKEYGFIYDASLINSSANEFYNSMDRKSFRKIDDYVYMKDQIYEFETPVFELFTLKLPFAGGGFYRVLPFYMYKFLFKLATRKKNTFMFFIHPYEIVNRKILFYKKLNLKDRFRINYGRKRIFKKIVKSLRMYENSGFHFSTYSEYLKKIIEKH